MCACCADDPEQEVIHSDYDEIDDEKDDGCWSETEFDFEEFDFEEFEEVPQEKVSYYNVSVVHVGGESCMRPFKASTMKNLQPANRDASKGS